MSIGVINKVTAVTTIDVTMFTVESFQDWLANEMGDRGWSQAELARRADVTRGAISLILSQGRQPGLDTVTGIAHAFGYSVDFVLRKINQMPVRPEDDPELEEANYLLNQMSPDARRIALALLRTLYEQHAPKKPREHTKPRVADAGEK